MTINLKVVLKLKKIHLSKKNKFKNKKIKNLKQLLNKLLNRMN